VQVLTLLNFKRISLCSRAIANEGDTKIAPGGSDSTRVQDQPFIPGHKQCSQYSQSRDPLTSNRRMIMPKFKITFFRLVAGLRCPVVLSPRSSCVPVLSFWRAEYLPAIRSYIVSYRISRYICPWPPPHPVPGRGGGSSSWTVQTPLLFVSSCLVRPWTIQI
jgi:hypothetical protein